MIFHLIIPFKNMALIIDIETNGLPNCSGFSYGKYPNYDDLDKYKSSRIVQISMLLCNKKFERTELKEFIVKASDFTIDNSRFHGITNEISSEKGVLFSEVAEEFLNKLKKVKCIIAHNANFDITIIKSELYRAGLHSIIDELKTKRILCSMKQTKNMVKAKNIYGIKDPSLAELYKFVIKKEIEKTNNVINLHEIISKLNNI